MAWADFDLNITTVIFSFSPSSFLRNNAKDTMDDGDDPDHRQLRTQTDAVYFHATGVLQDVLWIICPTT